MATRHIVAAVIFGVAIGLGMHYLMGGNPAVHVGIAIVGALAGAWIGTRGLKG
jgi:hypothetical protein